jgi:hypothetical protein
MKILPGTLFRARRTFYLQETPLAAGEVFMYLKTIEMNSGEEVFVHFFLLPNGKKGSYISYGNIKHSLIGDERFIERVEL